MRSVSPTMMHGVDALRGVFETFDRNGSGGIDLEELEAAFKVLGVPVSKAHAEKMLAEADLDGSGEIGFEEFCAVLDKGDGGHLAHLIHKTLADRGAREDVKERGVSCNTAPFNLSNSLPRCARSACGFSRCTCIRRVSKRRPRSWLRVRPLLSGFKHHHPQGALRV